jgi:hypothetical protein
MQVSAGRLAVPWIAVTHCFCKPVSCGHTVNMTINGEQELLTKNVCPQASRVPPLYASSIDSYLRSKPYEQDEGYLPM